jgi:hypothetical protein
MLDQRQVRLVVSCFGIALALLNLLAITQVRVSYAQTPPATKIQYGAVETGEITDTIRKVTFEFDAKAGDYVVAQLLPAVDNALIGGNLTILDTRGRVIADSAQLIIFGQLGEILVGEPTQDGTYSLEVSISANSTSTGSFEVTLDNAPLLEIEKTVSGTLTEIEEGKRLRYQTFFAIESRETVDIALVREGNYDPTLVLFSTEQGNALLPAAYLGGRGLVGGSLRVPGSRSPQILGLGSLGFGNPSNGNPSATSEYSLTVFTAR